VYERLGPLEREILELVKFRRRQGYKEIGNVKGICKFLKNLKILEDPSPNFYKSVCRAVKSLKRKRYLKTEFKNWVNPLTHKNTRYKEISVGQRMYNEKEWLRWYKRRIP